MICRCHLKLSKDSYQEKNDFKPWSREEKRRKVVGSSVVDKRAESHATAAAANVVKLA